MKELLKSKNLLWGAALVALFVISFSYIFDSKLNLNGDNCYYFANATSLARGDGYADMFGKPTTNFPPGYPLLMAPLRMVTVILPYCSLHSVLIALITPVSVAV